MGGFTGRKDVLSVVALDLVSMALIISEIKGEEIM
jgi:hypothetical protein